VGFWSLGHRYEKSFLCQAFFLKESVCVMIGFCVSVRQAERARRKRSVFESELNIFHNQVATV
jgi:hypothetical protein